MIGPLSQRVRTVSVLAVGAMILGACGGGTPDSFAGAEENFFVGCLEPVGNQVAEFDGGELVDPGKYDNLDQCDQMWFEISGFERGADPPAEDSGSDTGAEPAGALSFDDFSLANEALEEEPDLLELDEVPTGLVDADDQQRLEDTVDILKGIAVDASRLGST